jgi:glucose-6-phosphate isomerase
MMPPAALAARLAEERLATKIWRRDAAAFSTAGAPKGQAEAVRQRLGWLDAPELAGTWLDDLATFAALARDAGLTDVYLLGMGGSSLCAEVYRDVPGPRTDACTLTVLDTTDERAIRHVTDGLDPTRALFIVASKSGTTLEVTSLEAHFWTRMREARGESAGSHFVAITDPDSPLEALADKRAYRRTFLNPADIGGRYAALSLFGLVPAALLGLDLPTLAESARRMAGRTEADEASNPGLALGAFLAGQAAAGRDKLTLLLSPAFHALGPWIEQLVAESTGKQGLGILPVVGEPLGGPDDYAPDRAFVLVRSSFAPGLDECAAALEAAGHPVFTIDTAPSDLGGEFFRWEFATAVAGSALGVNPFDEPNVRDAKERTQKQLDLRRLRGAFGIDPPFQKGQAYSRREHRPERTGDEGWTRGRYVAILDYLPTDVRRPDVVAGLRAAVRRRTRLATTHGIGPRYLHSTGQYHKGGPNTGVFLLVTSVDAGATPVPRTDYTFSALKMAQALGDFDALVAADREVVHYHLEDPTGDTTEALERVLRALR